MERAIFDKFREIVYQKSGISLGEQKEALVSSRVSKRMRALGLTEYRDYIALVLNDRSGEEIVQLIDAISTNVTSFFREADHFDFLKQALTKWEAAGQRRFRIWSAASSSGEEPYSIAITLLDTLQSKGVDARILGTDISTRVLEKCRAGVYEQDKTNSIPHGLRDKYFTRLRRNDTVLYEAKPALKNMALFRRLNLANTPYPMKGPLDVVFCRNVMIYFDNEVRSRLLKEIARLLKPGGYLMVGHTESLTGIACGLKTVKPSVYVK